LEGNGASTRSFATTQGFFGVLNSNTTTSNTFSSHAIYIPNYRTSTAKSYSVETVTENNATTAYQYIVAGLWNSTAAITQITLRRSEGLNNLMEFSTASLYGIRKFNTSAQPKATGGAISFDAVNNKWVHVFSTSGTFTPTANITCEYLVVAGGGGGGDDGGAGGGAGGYRSSVSGQPSGGGASAESPLSLISGTNYTVTVGAGGAVNTTGSNSVFSTITSNGGGRGGSFSNVLAQSGGSGGGGSFFQSGSAPYTPGSGTTGQGFAGGTVGFDVGGGGGGGASAIGGNSVNAAGGAGGNGVASSITGTSITRAGGGGGGYRNGFGPGGAGGAGGGAAGGSGLPATANSGGGGGGGMAVGGTRGSAGGSGIVIVRYDA
jgi:hypothetical protein